MTLDDYLRVGETVTLGTHHFDAASIKAFAAKYDPQPFHTDGKLAESSVFGGLCASGWHTCAAWMKCNVAMPIGPHGRAWEGPGPQPVMGPSPGFSNLKWLKPVYAGETVTFTRVVHGHAPIHSRPGWRRVSLTSEGFDSTGAKVVSFDSEVLMKVE